MKEEGLEGNVIVQEQGLNLSNGTGAARKFEEEKRRWGWGKIWFGCRVGWCVWCLKWWPGGLKSGKIGALVWRVKMKMTNSIFYHL
jgi:hypothetical protein